MALNPEQLEKLRPMIASLGWQEVVKPVLANTGRLLLDALAEPSAMRGGDLKDASDDYLRGQFAAYRRMLTMFEMEVETDKINRIREEERNRENGIHAGSPYAHTGSEPA